MAGGGRRRNLRAIDEKRKVWNRRSFRPLNRLFFQEKKSEEFHLPSYILQIYMYIFIELCSSIQLINKDNNIYIGELCKVIRKFRKEK